MFTVELFVWLGFILFCGGAVGVCFALADPEVMGPTTPYRIVAALGAGMLAVAFIIAPHGVPYIGAVVITLMVLTIMLLAPELFRGARAIASYWFPFGFFGFRYLLRGRTRK